MRAQRVFFRSGPQSAENASKAEIVVLHKQKHDFRGSGGVSEGPPEAPGGAQGGARDGRKTEKARNGGTPRETTIWRDTRKAPGGKKQKKHRKWAPKMTPNHSVIFARERQKKRHRFAFVFFGAQGPLGSRF